MRFDCLFKKGHDHSFHSLIWGAVTQLACCCLASGNLWLSFRFKRPIQESRTLEAEEESVFGIGVATETSVFTPDFPFFFSKVTFEVPDTRFCQDTEVLSGHVLEHRRLLLPPRAPQTAANELLIELGSNKASGGKMSRSKQGLTDVGREKKKEGRSKAVLSRLQSGEMLEK